MQRPDEGRYIHGRGHEAVIFNSYCTHSAFDALYEGVRWISRVVKSHVIRSADRPASQDKDDQYAVVQTAVA